MNWDRVIDRGIRLSIVVSCIMIVSILFWGAVEVILNGPTWLNTGLTSISIVVVSLVYMFWGCWKE